MDDKGKVIKATELDNILRKYCKENDLTMTDLCGVMFILAQSFNSLISFFMSGEEFIKLLEENKIHGKMIRNLAPIMYQISDEINENHLGEEVDL